MFNSACWDIVVVFFLFQKIDNINNFSIECMTQQTQRIIRGRQHILTLRMKKPVTNDSTMNFPAEVIQPKQMQRSKIENGLSVQLQFRRQRRMLNIFNIVLLLNMVMLYLYVNMVVIQYQLDFGNNIYSSYILQMTFVVHVVKIGLILMQEMEVWNLMNQNQKDNYCWMMPLVKIVVIMGLHPIPWINQFTMETQYQDQNYQNNTYPLKINYILLLICILKDLLLLFPNFMINSYYLQPRSKRIHVMYNLSINHLLYAFKCMFKDIPIRIFTIVALVVIFYFVLAVRVLERGVPLQHNPFDYYQNCVWFIITSVTAVGFGDLTVKSDMGYIIMFLCCIWGTFNVSAIVVILINTLTLNSKQREALQVLGRIDLNCNYKQLCGQFIRESLWRLWLNYKKNLDFPKSRKQKKLKNALNHIKKRGHNQNFQGNFQQHLRHHFDNALINTDYLLQNNNHLLSFISNNMFMQSGGSRNKIFFTDKQLSISDNGSSDSSTQMNEIAELNMATVLQKIESVQEIPSVVCIQKEDRDMTNINLSENDKRGKHNDGIMIKVLLNSQVEYDENGDRIQQLQQINMGEVRNRRQI